MHREKNVFLDGTNGGDEGIEAEANEWAANFLVPRARWQRFIIAGEYDGAAIRRFAEEQGIAPGIVVGSLQHGRVLPWNRLNCLKAQLGWTDE